MLTKNWGSKNIWTKRSKNLFISPTEQFGEWIILHSDKL